MVWFSTLCYGVLIGAGSRTQSSVVSSSSMLRGSPVLGGDQKGLLVRGHVWQRRNCKGGIRCEAAAASSAEGSAFGPDANASPAPGRMETVRNLSWLSLHMRLNLHLHRQIPSCLLLLSISHWNILVGAFCGVLDWFSVSLSGHWKGFIKAILDHESTNFVLVPHQMSIWLKKSVQSSSTWQRLWWLYRCSSWCWYFSPLYSYSTSSAGELSTLLIRLVLSFILSIFSPWASSH